MIELKDRSPYIVRPPIVNSGLLWTCSEHFLQNILFCGDHGQTYLRKVSFTTRSLMTQGSLYGGTPSNVFMQHFTIIILNQTASYCPMTCTIIPCGKLLFKKNLHSWWTPPNNHFWNVLFHFMSEIYWGRINVTKFKAWQLLQFWICFSCLVL